MYDWMHVYLCNGLLDVERGMLMVALKQEQSPTTYSALGDYGRHGHSPKEAQLSLIYLMSQWQGIT